MSTVWLDGYAFAREVICAQREPWHDPGQLGAAYRDLQKLLPADVQVLPLSPLFDAARSRAGDSFFTAASFDRIIRRHEFVDALATGLASIQAAGIGAAVALMTPGPSTVLGEQRDIDFDDADQVLSSLCEILRLCGDRISAIVIEEESEAALEPADAVVNAARHAGLRSALITRGPPPENSILFDPVFSAHAGAASPWLGADWFAAPNLTSHAQHIMLSPTYDLAPETARARVAMARGSV